MFIFIFYQDKKEEPKKIKVDEDAEQSFITSTQDNPNRAANFNTSIVITPQVNNKNVNLIETDKKDARTSSIKANISSKTLKKLHAFSFSSEDDDITENDKKTENIEDKIDEGSSKAPMGHDNPKDNIMNPVDNAKEDNKATSKNPPSKEKLSAMLKSIGAPTLKKPKVAFSDPFGDDLEDDFFTEIQQQTAKPDSTQKSQIPSSSAINMKANDNFAKPLRPILKSSNVQPSSTQTNKQTPSLSRDKLLSMMNMIEKSKKIDNEVGREKAENSKAAVQETEKADHKAPNTDKIRSMFRSINKGPTVKPAKENTFNNAKDSTETNSKEVGNKEGPKPNKAAPSREKLLAMMKSIQSKHPPTVPSQNHSAVKKSATKMTSFDSDDDYDDLDINEFFKKK